MPGTDDTAPQDDPGHFARQGDYDDPQASLVHDDAIPPGVAEVLAQAPPPSDALNDPHYRAWRDVQMCALDTAYQEWRDAQARAYDASYLKWRDAAGDTSFRQWREAAASARLPAGPDSLFGRLQRP